MPENKTRELVKEAREKNVVVIGPATVGGIKPGCFRIGNTGGMIDNCIGCVAYGLMQHAADAYAQSRR